MSLFRIAVALSLGVAVMPSDKVQQEQLYDRAATAAHWTMTFCDRNGQTCQSASALWDTFLAKAEFAGKLAYDVAQRSSAEGGALATSVSQTRASGTLKPDDLGPRWRGSGERGGA